MQATDAARETAPGTAPETIEVEADKVGCDGGGDPVAGHPLVYLTFDAGGKVDCPYCGRRFVRRTARRGAPR